MMANAPLVSVITPVYKPVLKELAQCLASARATDVEHILVLDGESNATDRSQLDALVARFGARLVVRKENGGISRATNDGVDEATGEFVLFLDQDDYLEPNWAGLVALAAPRSDYIYSDAYVVTSKGKVLASLNKPDWSPLRLTFSMYACHFFAVRRELFVGLGGMRPAFDGAQDHDIALRASRATDRVTHIPQPLYNWRQSAASTAANPENKPWAFEAGVAAAQDHIDALGVSASVEFIPGAPGCYRAVYSPRTEPISVVIPTAFGGRDGGRPLLETLLRSIAGQIGTHSGDEIVIVSGGEDDKGVLDAAAATFGYSITHIVDSSPFNFSARCNIAMDAAHNELILLLNDDIEFTTETSLDQMVGNLAQPNVGLVGAILLYEDGSIQHAAHKYTRGGPMHAFYRWRTRNSYLGELLIDREVSGVTGAMMLQRKSVWRAVGGFSVEFPLNYNDVDYCLKIRALGYSIIQANTVSAIHHESQTRETHVGRDEKGLLFHRWPTSFVFDKFTQSG